MEIIADIFLFFSAFLLLVNLTPRDLFSYYKEQKRLLLKLKLKNNILGKLPNGINITPENSGMSIVQDIEGFLVLKKMVSRCFPDSPEINWENSIGIGYSKISAPVGKFSVVAFRPLYIVELPSDNSTTLILKPVGSFDDFEKWFMNQHSSFVNSLALILLLIGFTLQLISIIQ